MQFKIKSPCEGCPFRSDVHSYLERAAIIAKSLKNDQNWFACHQTTPQGTGRRVRPADQSQCMGSMRVLWRSGLTNVAMRLALAFGMLRKEDLERDHPPTFSCLEDFTQHHKHERPGR